MICKFFKKKKPKPVEELPEHYKIALEKMGVKEIAGAKHNSIIVDMFKRVVGKEYPDEVSWCAALVGSCLERVGINSTKSLLARSYLNFGQETNSPKRGDIVVFWRESPDSWKGHVGFYAGKSGSNILCLGGNQSNQVSIAHYPESRVLSYRKVVYV